MRQREINIGKVCNNDCVFCSNGTVTKAQRVWVPLQVVVDEIRRAAKDGFDALGFLGGEPTLRKDLVEIVQTAHDAGFHRIALCTNGRRLRDRTLVQSLVYAGVSRITLSVHSHLAEIEDEICRRSGAFSQKLDAIDTILEFQDELPHGFAINTVIHGRNVGRLAELASFFSVRGVGEIRFNLIRPEHLVVGDPAWIPRLSVLTQSIGRTVRWSLGTGSMKLTFSDVPLCVYPREFLSVPGLLTNLVGEWRDLDTSVVVQRDRDRDQFDWKGRRMNRLKRKTNRCINCGVSVVCEGVWAKYLDLYGDGDLSPVASDGAGWVRSLLESFGDRT